MSKLAEKGEKLGGGGLFSRLSAIIAAGLLRSILQQKHRGWSLPTVSKKEEPGYIDFSRATAYTREGLEFGSPRGHAKRGKGKERYHKRGGGSR